MLTLLMKGTIIKPLNALNCEISVNLGLILTKVTVLSLVPDERICICSNNKLTLVFIIFPKLSLTYDIL